MDDETLQFYRDNARSYADWAKAPSTRLVRFWACCPRAARCSNWAAAPAIIRPKMLAAGFAGASDRRLA